MTLYAYDYEELETKCGCWYYSGLNHATEVECRQFRFDEWVYETLAVATCICCKRKFLLSSIVHDAGDSSVGIGPSDICLYCSDDGDCYCAQCDRYKCAILNDPDYTFMCSCEV